MSNPNKYMVVQHLVTFLVISVCGIETWPQATAGHVGTHHPDKPGNRELLISCQLLLTFSKRISWHHFSPQWSPPEESGLDVWERQKKLVFQTFEDKETSPPLTAFKLPVHLYTDVSTQGLGTILTQEQEGRERIIYCTLPDTLSMLPRWTLNNFVGVLVTNLFLKWRFDILCLVKQDTKHLPEDL